MSETTLPHENQMFLDIVSSDGLIIAAKGLGINHVLATLIRVYSEPGNLVLVMGTNEAEEEFLIARCEIGNPELKVMKPKRLTSEYSTNERQRVYKEGGVLFATTRILVVDMLTERLPIPLVTGIIVCHAHKTAASCQESFILRLYRQKNKKGFIKAFSSTPVAFKAGYSKIDRIMRNLFVRELFLWPRFRVEVTEGLSTLSPEVVELHIDLTTSMMTIQTSILDLINFTMQELKRINPSLETYEELNVENALSRTFHKILQRELDPIWHQLSWKTKQLVADLKTLRTILTYLTQYDCITFYSFVSALRTTENALRSGGWMILDAADSLFTTAKGRVFGSSDASSSSSNFDLEKAFKESPKWNAFLEITEEIKKEVLEDTKITNYLSDKVLVLTSDEKTASQLQDLLTLGKEIFLKKLFNKALGEKYGKISGVDEPIAKEKKHKGLGKRSDRTLQTLTQMQRSEQDSKELVNDHQESSWKAITSPVFIIQSFHQTGFFEINKMIYEFQPKYVVLYDSDVSIVRQLEVYQAKNLERRQEVTLLEKKHENNTKVCRVRVYFLMYDKSVEEQAYLTSLRQEKEAFEHLMQEKNSMLIPEEREGKNDGDNPDLIRDSSKASDAIMQNTNAMTRKAGGSLEINRVSKVIVDMREFRSELPSLIHKRGIDIEPVTIEVGDYILTPDICIERKSISDLIGSLQNGRLYNQATNMTRFYSKPMLLIEFDQNKPFALQGKYYLSRDIASSDITARLQLLTLHFPKLRILWSPSPHATAELFEELKKGREEPDATKAAALTMDVVDDFHMDRYNPSIYDFVSKLPGVTTKNIYGLLNRVENLSDLLSFSHEELGDILGSSQNGDLLYNSLHDKVTIPTSESSSDKSVKRTATSDGNNKPSRFKTRRKR